MLKDGTPEAEANYNAMLARIGGTLRQVEELHIPISRRLKALLFWAKVRRRKVCLFDILLS
jgi:hypothetical protein